MSSLRNRTIGSIQLGPTLSWWIWTFSLFASAGLHKSSTKMIRGRFYVEGFAWVARESTRVFLLLGIWCKEKESNPDCKCLTWFKYSCILTFLASSSPFTWPMTNLKSENIFIVLCPIFWTMAIPTNKVSYLTWLFVVKKPNLKIFLNDDPFRRYCN